MATPSIRQFDQIIRTTERKLQGVRSGEVSSLTAGEQARVILHAGRGVRRVMRGKSPSGPEAAVDRVFAGAEERYQAELLAARQARQALVTEAAAKKVAKKASGWW